MKLVYVNDHRFIPIQDAVYSEGQFSTDYWERYLHVFNSITVIARQKNFYFNEPIKNLTFSSHPRVHFTFVPTLSSPKAWIKNRRIAAGVIVDALKKSDALISRLPSELGYLATKIARQMGKPWAVEVSGCAFGGMWYYGGLKGKIYAPIRFLKIRETIAKAPFVLYVTKRFLQRRYPNRYGMTVACSNVEIDEPEESVLELRLKRIFDNNPRPVRFGMIGSLSGKFKGIQTVIKALPIVRKQIADLEFHVLGGGNPKPWQKEAISKGVAELVFFDGLIPSGDPVMKWLDGIDIYLQPSLIEGLPRALIEAMSRACPAIGSFTGGIPELLEPEVLIKPGDYKKLASLMVKLSRDRDWQSIQAHRNWNVARRYASSTLKKLRRTFWSQFAKWIISSQGK